MAIKKIEIQDSNGNIYYPHTYSDVTFIKNASNNFKGETVEEALNELFQFADDGKKSIANVIGSPLSATDTFEKMLIKIGSLKNDMAGDLRIKGQIVSGTSSLKILIDKISNLKGFKYAKGTSSKKKGESDTIEVGFRPICVMTKTRSTSMTGESIHYIIKTDPIKDIFPDGYTASEKMGKGYSDYRHALAEIGSITANGFDFRAYIVNLSGFNYEITSIEWFALGIV